ncbi:WhiB family transcriptional regulator [Nonomuraea sediminis]|uniref:WhiB family transcriptional regulator n=1 Tax=Nonomuraea sediminis TaxID=2835864 RepID=UPI001BDD034A|nr:WhiB family transcriptional regulator [Nonomuraea sediminis]
MSSHIVASHRHTVTFDETPDLDAVLLTSDAKCRQPGTDPDDWYPLDDRQTGNEDYARTLCSGCPFAGLTGACVMRARTMPFDNWGIIGGTTPEQRRILGIGTYEVAA